MEFIAALQVTKATGQGGMKGGSDRGHAVVRKKAGLGLLLRPPGGQHQSQSAEKLRALAHPQLKEQLRKRCAIKNTTTLHKSENMPKTFLLVKLFM